MMKVKKCIIIWLILVISTITICAEGKGCWGQELSERVDTVSGSSGAGGGSSGGGGGGSGSSGGGNPVVLVLPDKPMNPQPLNGALGISRQLAATNGALICEVAADPSIEYTVYFGTDYPLTESNFLTWAYDDNDGATDGILTIDLSGLLLNILDPQTTYYWRVDAAGYDGTTIGDTWWFVTQ
ncbi:MAG: hypothetical protein HY811_03770 [Planctomycetes bacterium]|nr:hypothetical protein [Planctomycetota bacterium]